MHTAAWVPRAPEHPLLLEQMEQRHEELRLQHHARGQASKEPLEQWMGKPEDRQQKLAAAAAAT